MNWYKKAQYGNLNQWELVKMIQKLNPIYLEFLDKKRQSPLSPEEEVSMKQVGNKLDLLGDIKRKKIEEQREPSRKLIEEGKREAKERILGIVGQEVKFAMRQELTKLPSVKEQEHVSYNLISRLRLALKQKHLGG